MKNADGLARVVLAAALASGCVSDPPSQMPDPTDPVGNNQAARNPLPILMSCQLLPDNGQLDLSCTYQPPANAPFTAFVQVKANGSNFVTFDSSSAGTAKTVTKIDAGKLPLSVQAQIDLLPGQVTGLDASSYLLTQSFQFTSSDATTGAVHTVSLPFSIWTVTIAYQTDFPGGMLDAYSLDFGMSSPAGPANAQAVFEPGKPGVTVTAYVPVGPDTNSLTGKLFDTAMTPFTITGGGSYYFDATGLHAGPSTAGGTTGGGTTGGGTTGGTTACGADGQAQCVDSSGFTSCNNDCVYSSTDGLCHACGNDSQPMCRDASGTTFCNGGFVYSSADALCHACGKDNQPMCADSSGFTSCNSGYVYSSNDGLCHACGNDNQPMCADASGSTFCNNGFVYSSNDGLCHMQ